MTSDAWIAYGTLLFAPPKEFQLWYRGKISRPLCQFEYWCDKCKNKFASVTTPTRCPQGHLAEHDSQAIVLEHKGYTAKTFHFYSSHFQQREE